MPFDVVSAAPPYRAVNLHIDLVNVLGNVDVVSAADIAAAEVRSLIGPRDSQWLRKFPARLSDSRCRASVSGKVAKQYLGITITDIPYCPLISSF
jgi:hypothetical protein